MASAFDTAFETIAAPALLTQFGEEIAYTPSGGEASTLTGIVDRAATDRRDGEHGAANRTAWQVSLPTTAAAAAETDSGNYASSPMTGDTVIIDGQTYRVARVISLGPMTHLEIVAVAATQRTRKHWQQPMT